MPGMKGLGAIATLSNLFVGVNWLGPNNLRVKKYDYFSTIY